MDRLYGRADVLERARARVERAMGGAGGLLLFTGEPGIGKSRLSERLAAEATARGAAVAWGRCWEAGGAPAYWPWIQVFRDLQMDADPFAGAAPDLATGAADVRFAAYDRAVRLLKASATRRPLVLVLDDLHAADAPSLLLLLLLARELSRAPILVLGAYREAEARVTPDAAALLGKLEREAEVLPLSRLSPEDVAVWVGEALAEPNAARAAELYRLTEGHPLFLAEALRLGAGVISPGAWPLRLSAVLDERLGLLSTATRTLLEAAAVFGREFQLAELAATAETSDDRVAEALREALASSVVVPGLLRDQFRFSHVLLRDRLYEELLPSTRAALHFKAGSTLLALGAEPQAAIHHLFEGQSAGAPELVVEVALAAAEASLSRLAFEDAVRLGRRALSVGPATALPAALRAQLQLVIAESLIRLGEIAEGKLLCRDAAELAERADQSELLARAALVYGTELASGTLDPWMIALLRKALAGVAEGDSPLRARLMVRLAAALTPPIQLDAAPEILELMRAALAMARRMGDANTLLYVLQFGATVALLVPDDERFSMMRETVELARAQDRRLVLLATLPAYLTALIARLERERAEAELPAYDQLLEEFPQPLHRIRRLLVGSLLCMLDGDFERAEAASVEARALARRPGSGHGHMLWLTHRLSLAQLRDRPELLGADAEALLVHFQTNPSALPYMAWLLAGTGRRAEAARRLQETHLERLSNTSASLMDLMGGAAACVLLEDRELGAVLYPRLLRAADRMFWNLSPGCMLGPTARGLGDLALLLGRASDAVRHYDEALAASERLGSPPLIELCRRSRQLALTVSNPPLRPAPPEAPPSAAADPALGSVLLRREGELWAISLRAGTPVRLRHSKGLGYLCCLMEQPGRQIHVLELAGIEHRAGDAGAVLDPRAKAEYRQRFDALREQLEEAERFADVTRARRIEQEIDAIAEQLAGAVGLGGRDRRAASDAERTRINVQRRLKDALDRVAAADPALGRYLAAAVKTGTYCVYQPL